LCVGCWQVEFSESG